MIAANDAAAVGMERVETIPDLVGKTIAGVVVSRGRYPTAEFHLIFTDGTTYELYSDANIEGTAQLHGGSVDALVARGRRDGRSVHAIPAIEPPIY